MGSFSDTGHAPTGTRQAKQGYTELALCLVNQDPKTLKMSAYGTLSPLLRDPQGSCQHRGRCPHPRSPRGRGCRRRLLHPYHRALGRLQPVKAKPQAVASQALTGFQLRPLRIVLLHPRRWKGVKGDAVVHFTLDALEPTQHFATGSGGWVLTACPCGAASEAGVWGKAPRCLQRKASMYCKCMRLQKIQKPSDMKLGVSQHFDKSDHLR